MLSLMVALVVLGGPPVLKAGDVVQVPDRFYQRLERVEELPASYGTLEWRESRFGTWLEASTATGAEAIETIGARLGPPLKLPPWEPIPAREGYVYAMRTSSEAGLVIIIDRVSQRVDLKIYRSTRLPLAVDVRPPSLEWEMMLMTWFRWLTTPDEKLPAELRDAAKGGFPSLRATGRDPFAGP
ncbi:MAG: hypothetical protein H6701_07970 [Myxococcales bacterium]|nr:hypothetical protein [Myxococcales bacterium]MCB9551451.1 hypothetical protein [Myxococcales bacterium]